MSDYEKAKADLDYVLEEEGLSAAAVEKLLGLDNYIDQQQQRIRELVKKNAELVKLVTEAYFEGWDDSDKFGDEKKFDTASHFWLDSVSRTKSAAITETTKEQPR